MGEPFSLWPCTLTARIARELESSALARSGTETAPWIRRFRDGIERRALDEACDPLGYYVYEMLRHEALVEYALLVDGAEIAVAHPFGERFTWRSDVASTGALDRFVYLEQHGGAFALCAPEIPCRVRLCSASAASVLPSLLRVRSDAASAFEDALRQMLAAAGFMAGTQDESGARRYWEFADALFHHRSRSIGELPSRGATFRFAPEAPPIPKAVVADDAIALPVPNLPSDGLAAIMEARRSTRDFSGPAMPVCDLAELLYRVARIVERRMTQTTNGAYEGVLRPVPSAGAMGETVAYVCVDRCEGLARGLYRYDSRAHRLEPVCADTAEVDALLAHAARGCGISESRPHVLIILAARMARPAWKYEAIAYRNVMLEAGSMLYAFCLVAEELGLSACPIGSGDIGAFARATNADPYEETSMTELAIGVKGRTQTAFSRRGR